MLFFFFIFFNSQFSKFELHLFKCQFHEHTNCTSDGDLELSITCSDICNFSCDILSGRRQTNHKRENNNSKLRPLNSETDGFAIPWGTLKLYQIAKQTNKQTNLIGFFLDINDFALPIAKKTPDRLVDFRQKMIFDHGRTNQRQKWPSNVFVSRTMHSSNVAFA